jgi:hypothetical protein
LRGDINPQRSKSSTFRTEIFHRIRRNAILRPWRIGGGNVAIKAAFGRHADQVSMCEPRDVAEKIAPQLWAFLQPAFDVEDIHSNLGICAVLEAIGLSFSFGSKKSMEGCWEMCLDDCYIRKFGFVYALK